MNHRIPNSWLSRDGEHLVLNFEIPGFCKHETKISAFDQKIRLETVSDEEGKVPFADSVEVSETYDVMSAKASLENGLLKIRIGLRDERVCRRFFIEIE
jgi:HSP20 family molecular chaperone IbpA